MLRYSTCCGWSQAGCTHGQKQKHESNVWLGAVNACRFPPCSRLLHELRSCYISSLRKELKNDRLIRPW